ncbi:MAG TPA: NAD-dependent deacylase [Flavobacterium sp.]|jgi:NAD-dependent deacetylase
MKKKLVILSGAGISAESGISTFRDAGGLWEGHDVMEVASPQGFQKNPELVLEFYNQRRRQLLSVKPNAAHLIIAQFESDFDVTIVTQNVDNLHEQAGSSKIIHLHGELLKVRSTKNQSYILDWTHDLTLQDKDPHGNQLRPHIVWFGEEVPELERAAELVSNADILIVVGTSLQVYPAAGLMHFADPSIPVYYVDPKPAHIAYLPNPLTVIPEIASVGMQKVYEAIKK